MKIVKAKRKSHIFYWALAAVMAAALVTAGCKPEANSGDETTTESDNRRNDDGQKGGNRGKTAIKIRRKETAKIPAIRAAQARTAAKDPKKTGQRRQNQRQISLSRQKMTVSIRKLRTVLLRHI
ncbi:MAG: hypothetical protein ACTTKL_07335 [Treponema sp.]